MDDKNRLRLSNFTRKLLLVFVLLSWDIAVDLLYAISDPDNRLLFENKSLYELLYIGLRSNLLKNAVECGHFIGPLMRKELRLCKRFNWFAGKLENFIETERAKALKAMIGFVSILITVIVLMF